MTDGGKSRLFKVRNVCGDTFEVEALPYLTEPQSILKVYPEANLIVTKDTLFTLDGKIMRQHNKENISIEPVNDEWIILSDSLLDNDTRFQITFWDGTKERDYIWGRHLIKNDKYFAVYTSGDKRWLVYLRDGTLIVDVNNAETDMKICGNFCVALGIGAHSAYSLLPQKSILAEEHCIFQKQQLILCSNYADFALCANLQGMVQTYYCGKFSDFGQATMVDLYDEAGLFSICRNGRYFLYRFNGEPFAENICPCGADSVAYDKDDNTVLIDTNGVFRIIRL
ncbi:MAG: hypothetical protein IJ738_05690 [Alphaproteobacteria bacterium]|nr:hypothetical protein [Alphaproteobacteria bacterium]MBR1757037.1 hypothetical protein [Alphaproteobacteria bacterium]